MDTESTRPRDYEAIFQNVSDGLVVHHPETGEILDVNERFAEMLGYSREEALELSMGDVTADDWDPPMSAPERVRQARDEGQIKFEWRDQHKNGSTFWVEVNLSLIELDGEERVLASVRDISERKRRERRIRAIFDQTYQFTGLMEPDGTLLEANETALEFGDLDREDVIGKPFWECYWWQLSEETQAELRDAIDRAADGEFVRYDVEVQGGETTEVIDFSIRPVTDEQGEVTLLIPEGRVITEQRKQRQRLDVYNRVLRHNLRNQLTVIIGYAEQIAAETTDDRIEWIADAIRESSRRLEELSDRIREFDHRKRDGTRFERVDVADLLAELAGEFRQRYPDATVEVAADGPIVAHTNEGLLRLALENLLENGVEHASSPVELRAADEPDSTVVVEVSDAGPGIPPEELDPVLRNAEDQLNHSTGIGLWIVEWSVDELGGDLAFDTDETGTTATVRLPDGPET